MIQCLYIFSHESDSRITNVHSSVSQSFCHQNPSLSESCLLAIMPNGHHAYRLFSSLAILPIRSAFTTSKPVIKKVLRGQKYFYFVPIMQFFCVNHMNFTPVRHQNSLFHYSVQQVPLSYLNWLFC